MSWSSAQRDCKLFLRPSWRNSGAGAFFRLVAADRRWRNHLTCVDEDSTALRANRTALTVCPCRYRAAAQPIRLTPQEREIISLVAQGFSNREFAGQPTTSIRTVEGHLYRASQRLGIGSRDELGALMRDFNP
jgi:DNA-binding NarL/FixJ family response regulator